MINVDLSNDNVWILDKATGGMIGALGRCGISPCPGHGAGEFAFAHTGATVSNGDIYIAETITGRRIQKFTLNGDSNEYGH
jgi:isoaspartyl peptidase/L-asparaginase-like protein (Ntn-hydrolase superfamily)